MDYARVAYNGYRNYTGGKSLVSNQPIPEWESLNPKIKEAWGAAADAMYSAIRGEFQLCKKVQPQTS